MSSESAEEDVCGYSSHLKGKSYGAVLEKNLVRVLCKTYCDEEYKERLASLLKVEYLVFELKIDDKSYTLTIINQYLVLLKFSTYVSKKIFLNI
jgi:hypothetical protein